MSNSTSLLRGPIGYLVPEFPQQTHVFFWREVQALTALGVDVRLISTRKPDPSLCRHAFAQAAASSTYYAFPPRLTSTLRHAMRKPGRLVSGFKYTSALSERDMKSRLRQQALRLCALALADYCHKERIVHIHGHSCADVAHLLALCQRAHGPTYSLTLHGDLEVYGTDHQAKMAEAKFVSVVGHHLQQQVLAATDLTKERVWVTCMGIDSAKLAHQEERRSYTANQLRIVTVARLNPVKGHVHAMAAVQRLKEAGIAVTYVIVGGGEHREALEAETRARGLTETVTFKGSLGEEDVLAELMRADAFVLPSIGRGEAWPVSVMEAMACGLPVVSSIIGATPEMITQNVDGILVERGDEDGLTEALLRLAREPEFRRTLGTKARATAASRFDVRETAGRLIEAIAR